MLKFFMYFETVNNIFKFSILVNVVDAEYLYLTYFGSLLHLLII